MENMQDTLDNHERLKRALLALQKMQSKLDALEKVQKEPIAIIGIGCRMPGGVDTPETFWALLANQVDAITEVPANRWNINEYYDPNPDAAGKMYTRYGGFLDNIDGFDPAFFNIVPREALSLDPQHRLLLEVTWEALENAAIAPAWLRNSQTGVFIGISGNEYWQLLLTAGDPNEIDSYMGSGNAHSVAAGRLSYTLGLQGPCVAIDTACSSSLVAVHLACQNLRLRECDVAISGGVNLLITPHVSINHSRARMLAANGRCKTFDAAADGFIRSEGCGVIILKRLSDAQANGDNILALIRGTAVNQDGHTSGLTVPNGPSQQAVIRKALENGNVSPAQVSYVEAHGTGTSLGDPIEVGALGAIFSQVRSPNKPLIIGSVKTNLGHLESAAGIAGLIKVVLSLQYKKIPAHLHLKQPNPHIAWDEFPIIVPTEQIPWLSENEKRVAGVSSFGFGGTNAHAVLEEAPQVQSPKSPMERPLHLLTLSAKTFEALKQLAHCYANYLINPNDTGVTIADICFTANTGRSHFSHRLGVAATSSPELCEKLNAFAVGFDSASISQGQVPRENQLDIVFLFTGQGSQYVGMGSELYETQPTFRQILDHCDRILQPYLDKSILDILYPHKKNSTHNSPLNETAYTQPALFALEYALAKLWQSWGIEPSVVMGHSVGEYVAACVAGVFSLEDGLKLIVERGRLMQGLPQNSEMVAVLADESYVTTAIQNYTDEVSIAAINGPQNIVISGNRQAIKAIVVTMNAAGIKTKPLQVSHAFHSPLMEPILAEFKQVATKIIYAKPNIALVSNITGKFATADIATPDYWCHHLRQPVKFAASMATLEQQGYEIFVEIGSKPTLLGMGRQCWADDTGVWLPSLRQEQSDWQQLLQSLGELYVRGVSIDWAGFDHDYSRRRVQLPTYPFQRQRYWFKPTAPHLDFKKIKNQYHPLIHQRLQSPIQHPEIQFESHLSQDSPNYLKHHRIFHTAILSASCYFEMVQAAISMVCSSTHFVIKDMVFKQALVLPASDEKIVQLILTPDGKSVYTFEFFSLAQESRQPSWTLHATGRVYGEDNRPVVPRFDLATLQSEITTELSVKNFCTELSKNGIEFGINTTSVVKQIRTNEQAVLAQLCFSETLAIESKDYRLHPVLLDVCALVARAVFPKTFGQKVYLPMSTKRFCVYDRTEDTRWIYARTCTGKEEILLTDLYLLNDSGTVVAEVEKQAVRAINSEALLGKMVPEWLKNRLYAVEWQPRTNVHLPPDYLPTPTAIASTLQESVDKTITQSEDCAIYWKALLELETVSKFYIVKAFQQLGWQLQVNQSLTTAEILTKLSIVPKHRRLLVRLLQILAKAEMMLCNGETWTVCSVPQQQDTATQIQTLLTQYPIATAEFTLLDRCGSRLAEVLQNKCDPLQLLFPQDDMTAASIYQDFVVSQLMNDLTQQAITMVLAKLPADRQVRVLEIGAGTGGVTAYILPKLPSGQTEYVFTDISPLFISQAQKKFANYQFVRYQLLDIEQAPTEQGFADDKYDLIVAFNVLHATQDLRQTLSHVQTLLAPGGMLFLLENTLPMSWIDLIWGLTEGWWRFVDLDLRPTYPLLTVEKWQQLLRENGFEQAVSIMPDLSLYNTSAGQTLIIAQKFQQHYLAVWNKVEHWLVFADVQGMGQKLADLLTTRGGICTLVFPGEAYEQIAEWTFTVNPACLEDFKQLLTKILDNKLFSPSKVVYLWGIDAKKAEDLTVADLEAALLPSVGGTLHLVQALAQSSFQQTRLWLVTRNTQPISDVDDANLSGVAQAPLWGIGKNIALEYPALWGGMVDLGLPNKEDAVILLEEIWNSTDEDQLAFRKGQRYVARLVSKTPQSFQTIPLHAEGTYLITGGLGAFGLKAAQWLGDNGVRYLVLIGRRGVYSDATQMVIHELEQAGTKVLVVKADISVEEDMRKLFDTLKTSWPPLRGIIHAAGLPGYCTIANLDFNTIKIMLAAKVLGTWILSQLTKDLSLDFFACCSSMASVWGAKGQSHYVAANQFLDSFAHYGHKLGLPILSVNWGPLTGGGMLSLYSAEAESLVKLGVMATEMDQAIKAFSYLLGMDTAQTIMVDINWYLFKRAYEAKKRRPLFEQIDHRTIAPSDTVEQVQKREAISSRLEKASPTEHSKIITVYIQELVANVIKMNVSQLDIQQPLNMIGIDSLMAVELSNSIRTQLSVEVRIGEILAGVSIFELATLVTEQRTNITPQTQGKHQVEQLDLNKSGPSNSATEINQSNLVFGEI
jgi:malonyl CoA-acyl carrier protein transacylase